MDAELTAPQARALNPSFVNQCSLRGLEAKLPLRWRLPPEIPTPPRHHYRSHYVYLGYQDLYDPAIWEHLSDFGLLLRLSDFSDLRPLLAYLMGWKSARGWQPFDPLSIFLTQGWQITNRWTRSQTIQNLANPIYADDVRRFGYENGILPTEGGLRYSLTALGLNSQRLDKVVKVELDEKHSVEVTVQSLNDLIVASVRLIQEAGLLSPQAWQEALVCPDGMIHDAASRLRCNDVRDSCYQSLTAKSPHRSCPAKDKEHKGCDCDTIACAVACRYATPRDTAARFIFYEGHNQGKDNPNQSTASPAAQETPEKKAGQARYGWRSIPMLLADEERRFGLILADHFQSAEKREENPSAATLQQLPVYYPDLHLAVAAGDAGDGYESFLHTAYRLGARRMVALRAHDTDRDKQQWPVRGYDDQGCPVCPFGYAFASNGFDTLRQRHKWLCQHACLTQDPPLVKVDKAIYPPVECPYRASDHPHGKIVNVGERFADGSIRLVRDAQVNTPAWKRYYCRARNAAEARQSVMERWGFKRLPVYGEPRSKALIFQADVWANLTTLARLVREATMAAGP